MIVEIKDVIPGAIYQGETFTQTVVVELQNGAKLRIEDPNMRCSEDQVGDDVDIDISADIAKSIEPVSNGDIELEPVDPATGPGIKRLRTTVREIHSKDGVKTTLLLGLPAGELEFVLNNERYPDGLPEDYQPAVGDSLLFEGVSNLLLREISETVE